MDDRKYSGIEVVAFMDRAVNAYKKGYERGRRRAGTIIVLTTALITVAGVVTESLLRKATISILKSESESKTEQTND